MRSFPPSDCRQQGVPATPPPARPPLRWLPGAGSIFALLFALSLAPASGSWKVAEAPAPAGTVYYLTQRFTLNRPTGIHGIAMGTQVTLVEFLGEELKVKLPNGAEVLVRPDHLTQDDQLARQLAERDRQQTAETTEAQARAQARAAAETERRQKETAAAQHQVRQIENTVASAFATPRTSGLTGSALDKKGVVVAKVRPRKQKK